MYIYIYICVYTHICIAISTSISSCLSLLFLVGDGGAAVLFRCGQVKRRLDDHSVNYELQVVSGISVQTLIAHWIADIIGVMIPESFLNAR